MIEVGKLKCNRKCQISNCKNTALLKVCIKLNKHIQNGRKSYFENFHVCEDCLKLLQQQIGKNLVPKGVKSPFLPCFDKRNKNL